DAARRVADEGAERDADNPVHARLAVLVLAAAVLAALGAIVLLVLEVEKGRQLLVGDEDDVAAVAAIAPGRAALGHVRLAAECGDAVPAVAGADIDLGFVDEDHAAGAAAYTDTRRRSLPCRSYFTTPSMSANSV